MQLMSDQALVFNVEPQAFQQEVMERSQQVPILLLFWTDQVAPSVDTKRQLEAMVGRSGGKVLLGLVDVAEDQTLAQHLRVQGVPSIRVVQGGQLVDQIDGPQPETALQALIDGLTVSPVDQLRDQLQSNIDSEDFQSALEMLQRAINEEPQNQGFRVELADVLVMQGELDEAQKVLGGIPEETEDLHRPRLRLEFAQESAGMAGIGELMELHQTDPDDLEVRYQLAVRGVVQREYEFALDHAMAILQADREFRDDIGRTTMIRIFSLLGKGSDLASGYRRRMFAYMH
jgi:putative thioredoxin